MNYNSINCVCGPDCQSECCRRRNLGRQPGKTDEKLLCVPKGTSDDDSSSGSSYGSTDSTEPLMRGGMVSPSVISPSHLSTVYLSFILCVCVGGGGGGGSGLVCGWHCRWEVCGYQSYESPQKTESYRWGVWPLGLGLAG